MASNMTTAEATVIGAKTLWIGDVEPWMDENYMAGLFAGIASVQSVKLIRDKLKGTPVGYGFIEFPNHEVAKNVYLTLNGSPIPGTTRCYKLNWATHGNGGLKQVPATTVTAQPGPNTAPIAQGDFQIYVGDLDPNVNDQLLLGAFNKRYPSVLQAKVIVDPVSRYSKGYGFVKFGNQEESQRAIVEMQGKYLFNKPMKINNANAIQRREGPGGGGSGGGGGGHSQHPPAYNNPPPYGYPPPQMGGYYGMPPPGQDYYSQYYYPPPPPFGVPPPGAYPPPYDPYAMPPGGYYPSPIPPIQQNIQPQQQPLIQQQHQSPTQITQTQPKPDYNTQQQTQQQKTQPNPEQQFQQKPQNLPSQNIQPQFIPGPQGIPPPYYAPPPHLIPPPYGMYPQPMGIPPMMQNMPRNPKFDQQDYSSTGQQQIPGQIGFSQPPAGKQIKKNQIKFTSEEIDQMNKEFMKEIIEKPEVMYLY
ncbi:mrna binding post-transcriptional regulator [Stylonychia lemnae]|uniref:Mrna binding post-transcriptional regulator n=1 Tax=Stylonychia lemnae TaxID=5949 RepID=A0A077ZVR1_STYLE|nr:mrna binding post-transcriptional regulator [Stylonychia lemnae]|eukprot:CDW73706.1 mrna binding post-transcriptional regulator [Stylonychia lemnae]